MYSLKISEYSDPFWLPGPSSETKHFFRRGMGGKGKCTMNFNAKAPTLLLLIYPLWFLISRTVPSINDGKIEWGVFFGGVIFLGFRAQQKNEKIYLKTDCFFRSSACSYDEVLIRFRVFLLNFICVV